MIAVVVRNKFKNLKCFQAAIKADWFFAKATMMLTDCSGAILLTKSDGSFIEIALWKKKEKFEKLVNNPFLKSFIKASEALLVKPYKFEYFQVEFKAVLKELPQKSKSLTQETAGLDNEEDELKVLPTGKILEDRYKVVSPVRIDRRENLYKVFDIKLDIFLFLKEIPANLDIDNEKQQTWFKSQANLIAGLSHPGLLKVFDYFINNNKYYLVMSFIEGEDLVTILDKEDKLEGKLTNWTEEILEILNYLQSKNLKVLYQDIKPLNVIIDRDGHVVLTGFGLAEELYKKRKTKTIVLGENSYFTLEDYKYKDIEDEKSYVETRKGIKNKLTEGLFFAKGILESLPFIQQINRAKDKFYYILGDNFPGTFLMEKSFLENRYEIIEMVKSGGMGAIYKALDTKLGAICAVKELISSSRSYKEEERSVKWFKREASLLARLAHPNLPKVFDYFVSNNKYYLVMDFVEGENLEVILEKEGNPGLPEKKVLFWAREVLCVLNYLHNQNPPVIYRDIKPANIMINEKGKVMLVDFGIARVVTPDSQTLKTNIGTGGYAPVEQYQGEACPASDIYALGATMHHLLTGIVPIPFKFEPLKKVLLTITPELEEAVSKALSGNVKDRFPSAKDMLEALNSTGEIILVEEGSLNNKIDMLFAQGKYEEAVEIYDKIPSPDPRYVWTWVTKGGALKKEGKYEEAIICFDKAIEINPGYTWAWIAKGRTLKKQGKYEEAILCFDKAIEVNPLYAWAWSTRGIALEKQHKYSEAIVCYDRALEIDSLCTEARERKEKLLKVHNIR